jgi:hypothetical protein
MYQPESLQNLEPSTGEKGREGFQQEMYFPTAAVHGLAKDSRVSIKTVGALELKPAFRG